MDWSVISADVHVKQEPNPVQLRLIPSSKGCCIKVHLLINELASILDFGMHRCCEKCHKCVHVMEYDECCRCAPTARPAMNLLHDDPWDSEDEDDIWERAITTMPKSKKHNKYTT